MGGHLCNKQALGYNAAAFVAKIVGHFAKLVCDD
jgi:formylmethanofuran dehydrogenase subunit E